MKRRRRKIPAANYWLDTYRVSHGWHYSRLLDLLIVIAIIGGTIAGILNGLYR